VPPGLVIFDCDGVLVDSERLGVEIDVRVITTLGWAISRDEVITRFVGRSEADAIAEIEAYLGRPVPKDWSEQWAAEYRRAFAEKLDAVPGVDAAVAAVREAGHSVCVASSGGHQKIRRNLGLAGLAHHFGDHIFSATDVPRGKPAPDLFLHAAATMGFPANQCVVVEDSRHGVAAAQAAGMRVVGYAGGITPRPQLIDADVILEDMALLPGAIANFRSP
jgi:HAD superfamily hydrolase (TIGR01509 family)